MIAGFVKCAQAIAVGWLAQLHAEHRLELMIARANATLIEAECHGRQQVAGVLITNLWRRRDTDETGGKNDLIARRDRLVINYVENALGATRGGCVDCLRDVIDVRAGWVGSGRCDARCGAGQEPDHSMASRTIDAAEPQDCDREVSLPPERLPIEFGGDARAASACSRRYRWRGFVNPRAAAIPVHPEA